MCVYMVDPHWRIRTNKNRFYQQLFKHAVYTYYTFYNRPSLSELKSFLGMSANPWSTPRETLHTPQQQTTNAYRPYTTPSTYTPSASSSHHTAPSAAVPHSSTMTPATATATANATNHNSRSTPSAAGPMFQTPQRSHIRSQLLDVATSMGLKSGFNHHLPNPASSSSLSHQQRNFSTSSMSPQFEIGGINASSSHYDHTLWLEHGRFIRQRLEEWNQLQASLHEMNELLNSYEREQDVRDIVSLESMRDMCSELHAWSQHVCATFSIDSHIPVEQRDLRKMTYIEPSSGGGQYHTPAPRHVHPLLRNVLQPPVERFLYVEPQLQGSLREGIESMCRDVRQWKKKMINDQQRQQHSAGTTPQEALAWTNTLQEQQKPLVSITTKNTHNAHTQGGGGGG